MPRGYDRPLYVQPCDHRGSFETKTFAWHAPLSDAQTAEIAGAKRVVGSGVAHDGGVQPERRSSMEG